MKKIFLTLLTGAALLTSGNVSAQALEEGNVVIDAYYGFPNLYTTVFKTTYANSGTELDLKIGGIGPLGIRGEYLVTDKVGLGLDLGFNNSFVSYSELDQFDNKTYDYDFKTKKIGAIVTFNYHFVDNDQFDAYAVVGAGYGSRSFTFESTDPDYVSESISSLVPVAGKIGVGMRYFFTDNIGLNLNVGFGQGGIVNGGLSAKF